MTNESEPTKPTKEQLHQQLMQAGERLEKSKSHFITALSQRPCSALDYLYGQSIAAVVARDIAESQDLIRAGDFDRFPLLYERNILGEIEEFFESILSSHPEAGEFCNDYWDWHSAKDNYNSAPGASK